MDREGRKRDAFRKVLGTKYLVPSTWYQVLGTKYLLPSTWYQVHGTKYLVPSTLESLLLGGGVNPPWLMTEAAATGGVEPPWGLWRRTAATFPGEPS